MVRIIIALLFCFPVALSAQTYQQLSEKAIECIEKDSFHRAEELLLQALKLQPKNAKNALDRKSTRLNSSHTDSSRMPSSA